MVRSRGAVPIECDCPIGFFITPPVQIASRILLRSRRAAFDSDPAQAAASRANGQHWLRQSVLGTPWRDHPPQQQLSANTRATFDENRLGRPQRRLPRSRRGLEHRRVPQAAKPAMVMASHPAFKTRTDPPVNPVNHVASHTHQPSPSATPQPRAASPGLHHHAPRHTEVTERPTIRDCKFFGVTPEEKGDTCD